MIVRFQGKPFNITVIKAYALTSNTEEAEVEWFYEDLQDLLELTPKKDVLFITGDWNAKVGSQETPRVTGRVGLGIRNEAGQRLIEFCQEKALVITNTLFQQHKRRLYNGHHQMVNTKIRLIIFFAAEDGEALDSQQKQERELTVDSDHESDIFHSKLSHPRTALWTLSLTMNATPFLQRDSCPE